MTDNDVLSLTVSSGADIMGTVVLSSGEGRE